MSAYIVNRGHIRYLVAAALDIRGQGYSETGIRRYYHDGRTHEVTPESADRIGLMLWEECRRSVSARYPQDTDDELPGPIGDGPRYGYTHDPANPGPIDPLQVLSAVRCYEYQSCEHDGWKDSEAHAFCGALSHRAIQCIPGMDDCAWGAPDVWEEQTETPAGNVAAFPVRA